MWLLARSISTYQRFGQRRSPGAIPFCAPTSPLSNLRLQNSQPYSPGWLGPVLFLPCEGVRISECRAALCGTSLTRNMRPLLTLSQYGVGLLRELP